MMIIVIILLLSTTVSLACNITIQQYDALYALYTSTNGASWSNACNNWVFSLTNYSAPCSGWYGIYCNSQCNVTELSLPSCNLAGIIPSQLGYLTSMAYLILNSNSLTGTIPSQLGSLTSMTDLLLYGNSLTGTIPSQLGSMSSVTHLWLYSNSLTGTIPSQLGSMLSMVGLDLYSNSLTGTIPSQLGSMTSMQYLYLSSNRLTGTIPSQLGLLTNMTYLDLHESFLTGTIPSQLSMCISLQYIYLQDNNLIGTVPSSILALPKLISIDLSNNCRLGGNLASLFSTNTTKSLQYIILSSMSLTGSLPSALFSLPILNTLVLSSNCITGTLPYTVCSSNVSSLIIDGAGVGLFCGKGRRSFYGSIPSCLLTSSSLTTLYLAGNGLTGSLPDISQSSQLSVLNLISNRLKGEIPLSVQMHAFTTVDLSSNRLSGTLVESYQPPSLSLDLTVNRLSGEAPPALRTSNATVNVLQGNIFGCPLLRNDQNSRVTPCGSRSLVYPTITWLAILILVVIVVIVVFKTSADSTSIVFQINQFIALWWGSAYVKRDLYHAMSTLSYLDYACSMTVILVLLFVVVFMVSFIVIKLQGNSLYQVQYLYTTTAGYLVGWTPAVMVWIYLPISGLVVIALCIAKQQAHRYKVKGKRIDDNDKSEGAQVYQDSIKSVIIRILVEVFISVLTLVINFGFVRIKYVLQPPNITAVNQAFAVIKYIMNVIVVPYSTKLVSNAYKQSHSVLMLIMVNVVGPGLAVLISSPQCLYYYLWKNSFDSNYSYPGFICHSLTGCQRFTTTAVSVVTPEWFYSYECSSSFLELYLPVFVYLYIINGILTPLVKLLVMLLLSTGIASNYVTYSQRKTIFMYLNCLLQAIDDNLMIGGIFYIDYEEAKKDTVSQTSDVEMIVISERSSHDSVASRESVLRLSRLSNEEIKSKDSDYDADVEGLMPSLCVDTTMMLTLGIASPLFGIILACSIIINTLLWRLAVGRYITIVSKVMSRRACYEKLERAFEDQWRCLSRSWWMISILVGMFWSLFVHDMIGENDPIRGIVAAVMTMVWLQCVFLSLQLLLTVDPDSDNSGHGRLIDRIRYRVHDISSRTNDIIWRHVLRLETSDDTNSSSSSTVSEKSVKTTSDRISIASIDTSDRITTISETASPFVSTWVDK